MRLFGTGSVWGKIRKYVDGRCKGNHLHGLSAFLRSFRRCCSLRCRSFSFSLILFFTASGITGEMYGFGFIPTAMKTSPGANEVGGLVRGLSAKWFASQPLHCRRSMRASDAASAFCSEWINPWALPAGPWYDQILIPSAQSNGSTVMSLGVSHLAKSSILINCPDARFASWSMTRWIVTGVPENGLRGSQLFFPSGHMIGVSILGDSHASMSRFSLLRRAANFSFSDAEVNASLAACSNKVISDPFASRNFVWILSDWTSIPNSPADPVNLWRHMCKNSQGISG